jgi:hypothetical protein
MYGNRTSISTFPVEYATTTSTLLRVVFGSMAIANEPLELGMRKLIWAQNVTIAKTVYK